MLEIVELLADRPPVGAEHLLDVGRQAVLVAHHRDRRNVPDHRREHDADTRLAIGRDDDVGVFLVERRPDRACPARVVMPQRSDSSAPTRVRARSSSLLRFCAHRQRVEQPHLERQLLEQSAAQGVVRMVVRVDQAGHHQPTGASMISCAAGMRDSGRPQRSRRPSIRMSATRLMDVAVVVVDLSAADDDLIPTVHLGYPDCVRCLVDTLRAAVRAPLDDAWQIWCRGRP